MKPASFRYIAPCTLAEALRILDEESADAAVLAGGQSLVPLMRTRERTPATLVDINGVPGLDRVEFAQGVIKIGALVRHATLSTFEAVRTHCPVLVEAARHVGHHPVRTRGTFGGSVAHGHPAAELSAVAAAADGRVELASRSGFRTVRLDEFVVDAFTTTRRPDELVTAIQLQSLQGLGSGFHEITRRAREYALAGAVAAIGVSDGAVDRAHVSLFAVGPVARRLPEVEGVLVGACPAHLDLPALGQLAGRSAKIGDDELVPSAYQRHLAAVAVTRAVRDALTQARGRSR